MKKEDFVSTLVMTTVSILMLVGVTIAWYTAVYAHPTVTGMNMEAAEKGSIKVALEQGGKDILELEESKRYADIGLTELLNIVNGQMAPGAYGSVTFYVTSLDKSITSCQIVPSIMPGFETEATAEQRGEINEILEKHFDFYKTENMDMTELVDEENPILITFDTWDANAGVSEEEVITIYWKWHYEYPFTQAELEQMLDSEKEASIYNYDMEDTKIGNYLDTMSYHFEFLEE